MEDFALTVGDDGIAIVTFDAAGRSMNTLTARAQAELGEVVDRISGDPAIRGAILRSGKAGGFCVGADLVEMEGDLAAWRTAESQEALRAGVATAGRYSRRLRALETCPKPIAAAIAGPALGGGLELALACRVRVAAAGPSLRLALPETAIGLMPGGGATQRLPRLMGIARALPHLLDGVPIAPEAALETGVLHGVVAPDLLLDACRARLADAPPGAAWDVKGYALPGGGPNSAAGYRKFPFAVARLVGDRGTAYPGHANTLRAVYEGSQVPIDAGLRIEARYFFNTARAPAAAAMVQTLFHARQAHGRGAAGDVAGLVEALQLAWQDAAAGLVQSGDPQALVTGVARRLGWAVSLDGAAARHIDLPDPAAADRIADALLRATAMAAEDWRAARDLPAALIDLTAVQAGYPAWTGGPISFARSRG